LRDAASLEARGVPTIVYVNDVFRPIADATAGLLAMPREHLDITVIYLPHPTSMLARDAVTALINARGEELFDAAAGRAPKRLTGAPHATTVQANGAADPAATAREALAALAASLRGDGGELVIDGDAETVRVRLAFTDAGDCADGTCLLPPAALQAMIEAVLGSALPRTRVVYEDARA
jgi:hypothetical protein